MWGVLSRDAFEFLDASRRLHERVGVAAIEAYAREHHDTVDEDGDISGV